MKKRNVKGFTLAELLVVVAIIGILVAVSIPIFMSQLENSREATDMANLRAAKAEATSVYMTAVGTGVAVRNVAWNDSKNVSDGFTAYYDADSGELSTEVPSGYGKGTESIGSPRNTGMNYDPAVNYVDQYIIVTVDSEGHCSFGWHAVE